MCMVDSSELTRREFVKSAGLAVGATLVPGAGTVLAGERQARQSKPFRFVHLADIHVQPELSAEEGFRKCMAAVHALKPRPDFVLTGGDLVMDVLDVNEPRAKLIFDLYTRICADSDVPVRHCIGNHDVFGWSSKGAIAPDHASYGKNMVQERLELDRTSYSFEHGSWHFCVLDDILPHKEWGYVGGVSDADLEWLDRDLASAGDKPKVVCTHIPIVTAVLYRDKRSPRENSISFRTNLVCQNVGDILAVLRTHKVNLVLTGHLHQNEMIRFDGITFIGQGAVSGAWWKGAHLNNPEGFGVIDVQPDGTFEHDYQTYGWEAKS